MTSGSVKLNQVTVGVVPIEESTSVDIGVDSRPSTTAPNSRHRLRLMEAPLSATTGSAGFGFFWSGLLTGVKEEQGGGRHTVVGASTFTIPTPEPPAGPFFLGTFAGAVVEVGNARAGVAIGFAPQYHVRFRLQMGCIKFTNTSKLYDITSGSMYYCMDNISGMHQVPASI